MIHEPDTAIIKLFVELNLTTPGEPGNESKMV